MSPLLICVYLVSSARVSTRQRVKYLRNYRLISAAIWSCLLLPVSGYSEPSSGEDYTELSLKELMALGQCKLNCVSALI